MAEEQVLATEIPPVQSTTSEAQKSMLKMGTRNNICAYLDKATRNSKKFKGIIEFLKRSRIFKAISTPCIPNQSHVTSFWENAQVVRADTKVEIRSNVLGVDVLVNQDIIRQVIGFVDSSDQPAMLNKYLVRGLFLRIKYQGKITQGVLKKSDLSPQYKYLCHVLQHCLSPRRAGHDEMRESIQSAFVALVLNIPFNFSGMVLTHMIENLEIKREKYLMYARFIQMIINVQAPNLPKHDDDAIQLETMNDTTMGRMLVYKSKDVKPTEKRLIGHLVNPKYRCPGGKKWRHDDSDSDVEDIVVPQQSDSDEDGGTLNVSSVPTGSSVEGGSSSQVLRDEDNVEEDETPLNRKRKDPPTVRSLGDILKEQKREKKAKRFKLIRRSDTTTFFSTSTVPPASASTVPPVPPPTQPIMTTSTTTTTTVATSSSMMTSESTQLAALNAMLLQVLARQTAQDEEIKILNVAVAKGENERAEMAETIKGQKLILDNQQLMLEASAEENKQLVIFTQDQANKLKKLKSDFIQLQNNMVVGEDRIFRLNTPDVASDEGVDDEDTDSDSDDVGPTTGTTDKQFNITPISHQKSKVNLFAR